MNETIFAVFSLGFVLGMRHALEPDHLVAVSTLVSRNNSIARSSMAGALWGAGHTASLFVCGAVALALRSSIPKEFVTWAETAVAIVLVLLGINALRQLTKIWKLHVHVHTHDGSRHIHFHLHRKAEAEIHEHQHHSSNQAKSFLVGMLHGLAGSGALMVLVFATVPSIISGLIYIVLFGLGSIGGMLLLSSIISIPFALSAGRYQAINNGLQLTSAVMSIGLGLFWIL
ncbi:MAG: sulfite exporter TauE/SafE family protein [Acidobacteria bacterium]|nr:sulfite exporter TauE/SafE family protein [Acidobacteriota bacterium]